MMIISNADINVHDEGDIYMEIEKRDFIEWVKVHRKELFFAGICVITIIGAILGFKNRKELFALWTTLEGKIKSIDRGHVLPKAVKETDRILIVEPKKIVQTLEKRKVTEIPQEVSSHIRNLPEGWKASAEKVATADENGYSLQLGQTWVGSYTKNKMAS